jgi:hypothetical protein
MARALATAETLTQFSNTLKTNHDDILSLKAAMDNELRSFIWDDPVGQAFIARYFEDMKPIEAKLIPNLEAYSSYLDQEAALVSEFGKI